jgi:predicted N-formylglutamate amidohydrolase
LNGLLAANDPKPVRKTGEVLSNSPFLLVGDHAGRAMPAALQGLGLPESERRRHIAVDIGVRELGLALSTSLDAPFLHQAYSRLVIDCNRDPAHAESIPSSSDGTPIPGNAGLRPANRQARIKDIFQPYHQAIAAALDVRAAVGRETILVSLHSFTPQMNRYARPWHVGVLHDGRRDEFALSVLARLRGQTSWVIGDNEPYRMDQTDYTVPHHAYPRGLRYLELEVRQDLMEPEVHGGVDKVAALIATALAGAA